MTNFIKRIEVRGLWGQYDLDWELSPRVNVLSGTNGSGKSTIIKCMSDMFFDGELSDKRKKLIKKLSVEFDDGTRVDSDTKFDPQPFNLHIISTFDMGLKEREALQRISDGEVCTELDWEIYKLDREFVSYKLTAYNQLVEAMQNNEPTEPILRRLNIFYDLIDKLFADSDKTINRRHNSLSFLIEKHKISPYQLSSGEKQILIIMTTVLVRNGKSGIMLMDEPEISLHFDWQGQLIEDIVSLNPKMQLIIATHSPAVIMRGWVDCVSEISGLIEQTPQQNRQK